MTFKDVQELIKLINKSNLTEFKLKDKEFEISIKTNKAGKKKTLVQQVAPVAPQAPVIPMAPVQQPMVTPAVPQPSPAPQPAAEKSTKEEPDESKYIEVKAPMIGTFYRSSSPDKPPFVSVGDKITPDSVVCIIEAMKLFNEIEADVSGTIVKVMVEDAAPVEYDQVLFLVDPA